MFNLHNRHFLKEIDFSPKEWKFLVQLSRDLKTLKYAGVRNESLKGKNIVLIFEKASTRTRCAFDVAAFDLGMHVTYLSPDGSHLGKKESVADTARVLGRMYDGIEYRGFGQEVVEELAKYAGVPVWNGLTNEWHPTQMLADAMTMQEAIPEKPLSQMAIAYVGDAQNNVGNSILVSSALLGMDVRIGAPKTLQPNQNIQDHAKSIAALTGARITITDDPFVAVRGANFIYTDVWVSMGEPDEVWAQRINLLKPYQVNKKLFESTGQQSFFLHCLPAFHDQKTAVGQKVGKQFGMDALEVTDDVFEHPRSIVFDQAENRMHSIKAVMFATLGGNL